MFIGDLFADYLIGLSLSLDSNDDENGEADRE